MFHPLNIHVCCKSKLRFSWSETTSRFVAKKSLGTFYCFTAQTAVEYICSIILIYILRPTSSSNTKAYEEEEVATLCQMLF